MMRCPSVGPIPGKVSSSSSEAVLMLTSPPPGPDAPPAPLTELPDPTVDPRLPITTCSPSVRSAARLMLVRSAPGRAPPARWSASTTREPTGSSYTPGERTHPATSTTTTPGEGDGVATAPGGDANAGAVRPTAASTRTWLGRERTYQRTPPPT